MTNTVNARGDIVVACLQDVPNCVREVAGHGVRRGASMALATAHIQTGCDLWLKEPIFPKGEEREEFEELADDLSMAASAIAEDVSIEAVNGNVFADD